MRTRLLNLLLAAILALAGVRLWSFVRAPLPALPTAEESSSSAPANPPPTAAETEKTETERTEAAGAEKVETSYDVIVARDLFSPARGVVPPAPARAASPAPKAVPQPKLTLYGVVILDGEKSAFLVEGAQDVRPKKVREGDAFAGGTVRAIRPDGITFSFAGSEVAVPLRTPKDAGGGPRAPESVAGQQVAPGFPRRTVQPDGSQVTGGRPRVGHPGVQPEEVPPEDVGQEEIDQGGEEEYYMEEGGEEIDEGDLGDGSEEIIEEPTE